MARKYWPEDDWPLPVRVVCDTPEAVMEALRSLPKRGEVVVVEHDGKRVAAIMSPEDLALYETLFAEEEERMDIAKRGGGGESWRP